MVQDEWHRLLEKSLEREDNCTWLALLHLGVMRLESFDEAGAEAAWEASIRLSPSIWAYRNLGQLYKRQHKETAAAQAYEEAWRLAVEQDLYLPAFAVEILRMELEAQKPEQAMEVYRSLPKDIQATDRIQILRGQIAVELGDLEAVEEVLNREYSIVQEGETVLSDLWFELQAGKLAASSGQPVSETLRQQARAQFPPPRRIDFRSVVE
jgi:tetratricopeptide (TPR) repeat protein